MARQRVHGLSPISPLPSDLQMLAHRRFCVGNYLPLTSTVYPHFGSIDWPKRFSIKRSFEVTFVSKNCNILRGFRDLRIIQGVRFDGEFIDGVDILLKI